MTLLRHLFLAFGCLHLVGGPYALVQAYAWANMLIDYSEATSLTQAVADTFSGEKPCCLCKKIAESKAAEPESGNGEKPHAPLAVKHFHELFAQTNERLGEPFSIPFPHPGFTPLAQSVSPPASGPPTPPPRC